MAIAITDSQIADLRSKHYNAALVDLRLFNPELGILRVQPDYPIPPHKAGQYTTLGLGYWEPRVPDCQEERLADGDLTKMIRRAYSISHPIVDDQQLLYPEQNKQWVEFYVVLVRKASPEKAPALTPRLFSLKRGDRLYLGEKFTGHFTLDQVQPRDTVLFLSTGTGEAPHNYMLWDLLRRGHEGRILGCCCVRYRQDLAYLTVHEELQKRYGNYVYVPLTTREAENKSNKKYVQDLLLSGDLEKRLGENLDPARTHVFLCGNPNMIGVPTVDKTTGARVYPQPTGIIEILEKRGFKADQGSKDRGNIHYEEYW